MRYYAFVCIITPFFISSYINDNFKHPYKSESQNGHIIEDRLFANKTEMKLGFKCILIFCRYKDTQKKNETPDDNTHDMCFTLSYNVQALRYLVDTTCLELAKPANTFYRLSCSEPANYHCLLDGTSTREVEVCRRWKYISKGKKNHVSFVYVLSKSIVLILIHVKILYAVFISPNHDQKRIFAQL